MHPHAVLPVLGDRTVTPEDARDVRVADHLPTLPRDRFLLKEPDAVGAHRLRDTDWLVRPRHDLLLFRVTCGRLAGESAVFRLTVSHPTRLETVPASRASADQRAGRAGRLGPGVAVRLWSKVEHAARRADVEYLGPCSADEDTSPSRASASLNPSITWYSDWASSSLATSDGSL